MQNTSFLSRLLSRSTYRKDIGEDIMASRPRITIIGTGFVGTSLGLGLQRVRQQNSFEIVGHDRSAPAAAAAKKRNAIDRSDWNLISSVEQADMIFIATPVQAVRETLTLIAEHLKPGAIVTDTAGTKSQVMRWAAEILPGTVNFIGGDPMLGREGAPVETASPDVFNKTHYCLVPATSADADAIRILADFVSGLGAQPYFIDADEHDGIAAAASQLPFLMSLAMLNTAAHSPSWAEIQKMAGENFKSAAAPINSDTDRWQGLALTNTAAMSRWIDGAVNELQTLKSVIETEDAEKIEKLLDQSREAFIRMLNAGEPEDNPMKEVGRDRFRQIFFGGLGGRRQEKSKDDRR